MRRLEASTGMVSARDTTLYSLAARTGTDVTMGPDNTQSIEAPFIVRRGDYYYLFASYDMCCRGARSSYNIRVGRSEAVTGPYLDERGEVMTRGGGDVVLATVGRVPDHAHIPQRYHPVRPRAPAAVVARGAGPAAAARPASRSRSRDHQAGRYLLRLLDGERHLHAPFARPGAVGAPPARLRGPAGDAAFLGRH